LYIIVGSLAALCQAVAVVVGRRHSKAMLAGHEALRADTSFSQAS
jgi:hypothetical protein